VALGALPLPVAAQNGGLRGRVVDPSGDPLAGVQVTLSFLGGVNRTVSVDSDDRGNFVRMGIRLGEYRMELSREGYGIHEETVRIRPGAPTRVGEITLNPLAPVVANPPSGSANIKAGQDALREENHQAAVDAFRAEIADRPESTEAHRLLGIALRLLGETDEARSTLERAIGFDPENALAWGALADLEAGRGNWPATVSALEAAIRLEPDARDFRFRVGGALMNGGDLNRAAEVFGALPGDAGARYQLGMIALNRGRNEEAISHLERVLELAPDTEDASRARGILEALRPESGE